MSDEWAIWLVVAMLVTGLLAVLAALMLRWEGRKRRRGRPVHLWQR